jgi:hypothetical protein
MTPDCIVGDVGVAAGGGSVPTGIAGTVIAFAGAAGAALAAGGAMTGADGFAGPTWSPANGDTPGSGVDRAPAGALAVTGTTEGGNCIAGGDAGAADTEATGVAAIGGGTDGAR